MAVLKEFSAQSTAISGCGYSSQLSCSAYNINVPSLCFTFCRSSAELFATSSHSDVRVWHTETGKELLRLSVPNLICHAVEITPDGKAIITGWIMQ